MSRVNYREVTRVRYFPESVSLDHGIDFSMRCVNRENGRLLDPAASTKMPNKPFEAGQYLSRIFEIYSSLYPNTTQVDLTNKLVSHSLAFLFPCGKKNASDIDLTFGVYQAGLLNGLGINLTPIAKDSDKKLVTRLSRDKITNLPMVIGGPANIRDYMPTVTLV